MQNPQISKVNLFFIWAICVCLGIGGAVGGGIAARGGEDET
jgi:hypothetical protein